MKFVFLKLFFRNNVFLKCDFCFFPYESDNTVVNAGHMRWTVTESAGDLR